MICQLARDRYGVETTIARVNDPRNQPYFDLLGITPTVSATASIMGLIEHEVPEHGLIHLLELRKENLEIVEILVDPDADCAGKSIREVGASRRVARHLDRPERQGGGARRRDAARAGRLGARDPRARQGRRARRPRPAGVRLAAGVLVAVALRRVGGSRGGGNRAPTGRWPASRRRATTRPGHRDREEEHRPPAPPAGDAPRDGRLVADLPARREGRGKSARHLLRHHDLRDRACDRRRERPDPLAVHAARLLELRRLGPDHHDDAGRRSGPGRDLRGAPDGGSASSRSRPARCSGRPRSRATRPTRSSPRRSTSRAAS